MAECMCMCMCVTHTPEYTRETFQLALWRSGERGKGREGGEKERAKYHVWHCLIFSSPFTSVWPAPSVGIG